MKISKKLIKTAVEVVYWAAVAAMGIWDTAIIVTILSGGDTGDVWGILTFREMPGCILIGTAAFSLFAGAWCTAWMRTDTSEQAEQLDYENSKG